MKGKKNEPLYDIPHAALELRLSQAYIRLMIRQGVIETIKVPVSEGSTVTKHMMTRSVLDAFANRDEKRAPRREDGRGKYCFYATPDEAKRVKETLYLTRDPGLSIVAQTIQLKGQDPNGDNYVSPSRLGPSNEPSDPS